MGMLKPANAVQHPLAAALAGSGGISDSSSGGGGSHHRSSCSAAAAASRRGVCSLAGAGSSLDQATSEQQQLLVLPHGREELPCLPGRVDVLGTGGPAARERDAPDSCSGDRGALISALGHHETQLTAGTESGSGTEQGIALTGTTMHPVPKDVAGTGVAGIEAVKGAARHPPAGLMSPASGLPSSRSAEIHVHSSKPTANVGPSPPPPSPPSELPPKPPRTTASTQHVISLQPRVILLQRGQSPTQSHAGPLPGASSTTIPHQNPPPISSSSANALQNQHGAGTEDAVTEDAADAHGRFAGAAGPGTSGALLTAVVCLPARDVAQDEVMEVVVRAQGAFVPTVVWARSRASGEEGPAPTVESEAAAQEAGLPAVADAGAAVLLLSSGDRGDQRSTASSHQHNDTYDIELLDLPPRPGLLLVELRRDGQPGHALPVVLTDDAGVGQELQHACATWAGSGEELDDLLLDLGTWSYHAAVTVEVLEAQAAAGGARAEAEGRLRVLQPLQARLGALGMHLLRHAEACGWNATVAWMQRALEQQGYGGGTAPAAEAEAVGAAAEGLPEPHELERAEAEHMKDGVEAGMAGSFAAAAGAAATVDAHAGPICSLWHAGGQTRMEPASAAPDRSGAPSHNGAEPRANSTTSAATPQTCASHPHADAGPRVGAAATCRGARVSRAVQALWAWLALLLQVLGLRPTPAHERSEYEAYTASWHAAGAFTIQSVEFISLLALLYRARHDPFNPSTLTSLSGTCVGTFTTLAWMVLPYAQWLRLANASKLVRYLFYMNAKLMIGCLGFPAPPGIVAYQIGPGMLVMEGIILPSSNLVHPAAATLLALAKVPLAVAMMTESGAAKSSREALPPLLLIALTSVVVTVLWHLQLRVSFARWKGRQGAVQRKVKPE